MRTLHPNRILTVCCLLGILLGIFTGNGNQESVIAAEGEPKPLTVKVVLQRIYLDGEISEEVKNETIFSMEDFLASYSNWKLIDHKKEVVVFQKHIDDISPLLKTNGYFGIDGEGTLTIFNGKPETNEVIQSFFQIDVNKLESRKHDELIQGIRIQSKDQYLDVLKSLQTYSKPEKK